MKLSCITDIYEIIIVSEGRFINTFNIKLLNKYYTKEEIDLFFKQLSEITAISFSIDGNYIICDLVDSKIEKSLKRMFCDVNNVLYLNIQNPMPEFGIEMLLKLSKDSLEDKAIDIDGISTQLFVNAKGIPIRTRTLGQAYYINNIINNDITFCVGPAGTGKTFLSTALAISYLKAKKIEKIVLTRPAVEAGEKLGFLPGDLQEKVDPYLRPVYDALEDFLGKEKYTKYIENGIIEVIPLAYMRGRSINNAFIILDEAQNTTKEQMKMFLTRIGNGSKAVVNGDITQIDLPFSVESGLVNALRVLKDIDSISILTLDGRDNMRNPIVKKIIEAYENAENKNKHNHIV